MEWSSTLAKLFDSYDLKARVFPGLLVLLPFIAFLVLAIGPKNPTLVAFGSVLLTCGGPYVLAGFVRTWGQRAQQRLFQEWGAQPTTILLRHRDARLPTQTKLRYHKLAEEKLNISMPTATEEAADPLAADQAYAAAADALRPLTGDPKQFPLIFKELTAYGFNRNAYASRWLGAAIAVATALAALLHGGALLAPNGVLDVSVLKSLGLPYVLTFVVSAMLLAMWLLHFTARTVEQAGYSYALRLWEALGKVSKN